MEAAHRAPMAVAGDALATLLRLDAASLMSPRVVAGVLGTVHGGAGARAARDGAAVQRAAPGADDDGDILAAEAFKDRQDTLDVAGTLSRGLSLGMDGGDGDDVITDDMMVRLWHDTGVEYEECVLAPRISALRLYHKALVAYMRLYVGRQARNTAALSRSRRVVPSPSSVLQLSHLQLLASLDPRAAQLTLGALDASCFVAFGRHSAAAASAARASVVGASRRAGDVDTDPALPFALADLLWSVVLAPVSVPGMVAQVAPATHASSSRSLKRAAVHALFNALACSGRVAEIVRLCHVVLDGLDMWGCDDAVCPVPLR